MSCPAHNYPGSFSEVQDNSSIASSSKIITCQPIPAKPRERRSEVVADTSQLTKEQRKRRRQHERFLPQINALYDDLHQRYPRTFVRDPEQIHPLKIGIGHDLRACVEALPRVLNYALRRYTTRPAYLRSLIAQKPRLDLCGRPLVRSPMTNERRRRCSSTSGKNGVGRKLFAGSRWMRSRATLIHSPALPTARARRPPPRVLPPRARSGVCRTPGSIFSVISRPQQARSVRLPLVLPWG